MYNYIIIEDESLIRKGTIKKLAALSELIFCCGEADNGKTGLLLIEKYSPDFVILDMNMPIMGGLELLPCLSKTYPDLPLIVISGYSKFDYMKQAISSKVVDYILKPFGADEIQEAVLRVIHTIQSNEQAHNHLNAIQEEKEKALYQLDLNCLSSLTLEPEAETSARQMVSDRLSHLNQPHRFLLCTLYAQADQDTAELWAALACSLNGQPYYDFTVQFPHYRNRQFQFILFLIPQESTQKKQYMDTFFDILSIWAGQQGQTVGISDIHRRPNELHAAWMEGCQALDSRVLTAQETVCRFRKDTSEPIQIRWGEEEAFLFRIEAGTQKEVAKWIDKLFDFYLTLGGCTLAAVKLHCRHLASRCSEILNFYLNDGHPRGAISDSVSMQSIVSNLLSLEDIKSYYLQFFLNVTALIHEKSVYANHDLAEQIMTYIQRNYPKDLTEEFVSSIFHLNRSYLSQFFRQKTGSKFIDYLTEVRIAKSKELLSDTEWKTEKIAKAVGYDNSKYFFRIFKKKTGVTPSQYRSEKS